MLAELRPAAVVGRATPRIAPPLPARSDLAAFRKTAAAVGYSLYPWQDTAARYLTAKGTGDRLLYREVAVIVARQNGKTTLLVPLIVSRLLAGKRIMHTAQNRELPREVFGLVADIMLAKHWSKLRGKPRFANGQEEIRLANGAHYRIVAPTRGGARGPSNDLVIIDELREMDDHDFIGAAKPTLAASPDPQIVYLSNAGTEESVVLNALRHRATEDPSLAYLEWSAAPERKADEIDGWLESNPSYGHKEGLAESIEAEYRAHRLGGTLAVFETEHLCRWVVSMRERLVDEYAWSVCEVDDLGKPVRPFMAVSMDPKGQRASAAIAWQLPDGGVAVEVVREATGSPIDTSLLGKDLRELALKYGARKVGGDPLTDGELAKFFRNWEPITGRPFANASSRFALAVQNRKLAWHADESLTDDLAWTTRKQHDESGSYQAVRADDDRPIPAALAAIRAVWLASGPSTSGGARIW
jgi:hypothetical protein